MKIAIELSQGTWPPNVRVIDVPDERFKDMPDPIGHSPFCMDIDDYGITDWKSFPNEAIAPTVESLNKWAAKTDANPMLTALVKDVAPDENVVTKAYVAFAYHLYTVNDVQMMFTGKI